MARLEACFDIPLICPPATMTIIVIISVISILAMPAESSSPKELSCPCADTFSFCDTFENKCVPCQDICQNQNSFADCQKDCPQYLQSVIFRHTVEKDDLQTLTIMVALTAAMTCVVMLAVFVLISMKLKKLKRLKKKIMPTSVFTVEKGKVEIDILANDTVSDNLVIKGSASHIPTQMRPSSLQPGTSMSTMVTQLSQESSIHLPSTETAITGVTNSRNSSGRFGKQPRRLPSEDCIPEVGGRCNIAMSPVPEDERGRAYTAPHSQVV